MAVSDRTPRYRSFKKDYGGDPDSTILKDLHRRLMKIEIAFAKLERMLVIIENDQIEVKRRLHYVLVAAGGTVGGDPPPPAD